jgi:hypothetical protein
MHAAFFLSRDVAQALTGERSSSLGEFAADQTKVVPEHE